MRTRDFGFAALGRFMVVEQYIQAHQPSSPHPVPGSGIHRSERHAHRLEGAGRSQASARRQRG